MEAMVGVDRMYVSLEMIADDNERDEEDEISGPDSGERRMRTEEAMVTGGDRVDR